MTDTLRCVIVGTGAVVAAAAAKADTSGRFSRLTDRLQLAAPGRVGAGASDDD